MRKIETTKKFRRDFKRVLAGRPDLETILQAVLELLMADERLPARYRDHALKGLDGVRDCHLKPDVILLSDFPDEDTLRLIRVGSHSDLSL